jgi:penicillin amidase
VKIYVAILLVIAAIALSLLASPLNLLSPTSGLFTLAGGGRFSNLTITMSQLTSPVTIEIDTHGMAHVYASDAGDLFRAEGYYEASQRLFQMEIFALLAAGNLSSWVGEQALQSDVAEHLIGIPQNAEMSAQYLQSHYPQVYSYLEDFSQGVNSYISSLNPRNLPLGFKLLHVKPYRWSPLYTLDIAEYMSWSLTAGFSDELQSAMLYSKYNFSMVQELNPYYPYYVDGNLTVMPGNGAVNGYSLTDQGISPSYLWSLDWYQGWATGVPSSTMKSLFYLLEQALGNISDPYVQFQDMGSNSWIVTSNYSTSGSPLLANDPHLTLTAPSIWIPIQLGGGGFNVTGWSLVGIPGVLIGHTATTAWGLTTPSGSSSNAYLERLNGSYYEFEGKWLPLTSYNYTLMGKTYTVYYTNNGPLVARSDNYGISLYWTAQKVPFLTVLAEILLDNSTNFSDLLRAAHYWVIPPQNLAIVSLHNAAIIDDGLYPLINETLPNCERVQVIGARAPLNGSSGNFEPYGYVPFNYLPAAYDPTRGFAFAPNQPTAWVNYPFPFVGGYWSSGGRAEIVYHYLASHPHATLANMEELQSNVTDYWALMFKPFLIEALTNFSTSPQELQALKQLEQWNGSTYQGQVGPTVYTYLVSELANITIYNSLSSNGLSQLDAPDLPYLVTDLIHIAQYDPNSPWVNGSFTSAVREAFVREIQYLNSTLGPNVSGWTWGKVHQLELYSPLGLTALSIGPTPQWGDSHTVAAAYFPYVVSVPLPFVTVGSSLRFVADPGDGQFYGVFPGGPSENVASYWFQNQLQAWLNFGYYPMGGNYSSVAQWRLLP